MISVFVLHCGKNMTLVDLSTKCNKKQGGYVQKQYLANCCVINLSKRLAPLLVPLWLPRILLYDTLNYHLNIGI
jgi:hypothetical protein